MTAQKLHETNKITITIYQSFKKMIYLLTYFLKIIHYFIRFHFYSIKKIKTYCQYEKIQQSHLLSSRKLSFDFNVLLIIFLYLILMYLISQLLKNLIGAKIEINADNIKNKTGHFVQYFG